MIWFLLSYGVCSERQATLLATSKLTCAGICRRHQCQLGVAWFCDGQHEHCASTAVISGLKQISSGAIKEQKQHVHAVSHKADFQYVMQCAVLLVVLYRASLAFLLPTKKKHGALLDFFSAVGPCSAIMYCAYGCVQLHKQCRSVTASVLTVAPGLRCLNTCNDSQAFSCLL